MILSRPGLAFPPMFLLYMDDLRAFGSLKYRTEDICLVSQPLPVLCLLNVLL